MQLKFFKILKHPIHCGCRCPGDARYRPSWGIACWRCSIYIFILDPTPAFNGFGKVNCKMRWESFKFWDVVPYIRDLIVYHFSILKWQMMLKFFVMDKDPSIRDHFVCVPSQWETTLQCNVVSHWPGACTKWCLISPTEAMSCLLRTWTPSQYKDRFSQV